jgi:peptidoglycan/xylan/chitin deacetylase (PgdA/CDA1 family)
LERNVRAHFRVIRVNRWGLALAILVVLALILLPGSRFGLRPVIGAGGASVVQPGVTVGMRDFSGLTEAEAKQVLSQMAHIYRDQPVSAYEAKDTDGYAYIIPEVNGYELDVEATWTRLLAARPNTRVEPATRLVTPSKKVSDFPKSIIRHGNPAKKEVALLINVDWGEEVLGGMLDTLKERGAKATFFVSGRWAAKNPNLMAAIVAGGHEVASHGHQLTEDGPEGLARRGVLRSDIERSVDVIEKATGLPVKFYAPHKSQVNPAIVKTADELKLRTVLYSLDTRDWMASTSVADIMATFQKVMAGDLILLHPKPNTAAALGQGIQHLQARGLTPVTLSELLSPEREGPATVGGDQR